MVAVTRRQHNLKPDLSPMTLSRHFVISGRVQGVGFRYSTKRKAEQLKLSGWVKNLPNGDVEVVAQGDPGMLAVFESWLWAGPDYARVSIVTVRSAEPADSTEFLILSR